MRFLPRGMAIPSYAALTFTRIRRRRARIGSRCSLRFRVRPTLSHVSPNGLPCAQGASRNAVATQGGFVSLGTSFLTGTWSLSLHRGQTDMSSNHRAVTSVLLWTPSGDVRFHVGNDIQWSNPLGIGGVVLAATARGLQAWVSERLCGEPNALAGRRGHVGGHRRGNREEAGERDADCVRA